jgi:flavin reductase (DIM6/NTAB) family NADH-FMN oxidoreductase RutF
MTVDDASAALSELRYTLLILGTNGPSGPHFMVGNWGTQASFDPWRFVMLLKRDANTLANVRARGAFTVNLLDEARRDAARQVMKGKADGQGEKGALDAPRLPGAYAGFDCRLLDVHDVGGDHVLVVADVVDGWKTGDGPALTLGDLKLSYSG